MAVEIGLLGSFAHRVDGVTVPLPVSAQRVLAYLALEGPDPVERRRIAGQLWPDSSDERAGANLRSTLWRLKPASPDAVVCTATATGLGPAVQVDVHDLSIEKLLNPKMVEQACFDSTLLAGWYDDWVLCHQERTRQRVLHLMDAACAELVARRQFARAIDLALRAVSAEPLRESPRRLLVEAHKGEGNLCEAVRSYERYACLLDEELGCEPTDAMKALLPMQSPQRVRDAAATLV